MDTLSKPFDVYKQHIKIYAHEIVKQYMHNDTAKIVYNYISDNTMYMLDAIHLYLERYYKHNDSYYVHGFGYITVILNTDVTVIVNNYESSLSTKSGSFVITKNFDILIHTNIYPYILDPCNYTYSELQKVMSIWYCSKNKRKNKLQFMANFIRMISNFKRTTHQITL